MRLARALASGLAFACLALAACAPRSDYQGGGRRTTPIEGDGGFEPGDASGTQVRDGGADATADAGVPVDADLDALGPLLDALAD